jgi:hypothetical protein
MPLARGPLSIYSVRTERRNFLKYAAGAVIAACAVSIPQSAAQVASL